MINFSRLLIKFFTYASTIAQLLVVGLISFHLVGCGGGDPDYESCTTVSGKTYCCRTYCSSDGKSCKTTCD